MNNITKRSKQWNSHRVIKRTQQHHTRTMRTRTSWDTNIQHFKQEKGTSTTTNSEINFQKTSNCSEIHLPFFIEVDPIRSSSDGDGTIRSSTRYPTTFFSGKPEPQLPPGGAAEPIKVTCGTDCCCGGCCWHPASSDRVVALLCSAANRRQTDETDSDSRCVCVNYRVGTRPAGWKTMEKSERGNF